MSFGKRTICQSGQSFVNNDSMPQFQCYWLCIVIEKIVAQFPYPDPHEHGCRLL